MKKPKKTNAGVPSAQQTVTDQLGQLLAASRRNAGLDEPPGDKLERLLAGGPVQSTAEACVGPIIEIVPPPPRRYPLELVASIAVQLVASVNRSEGTFGGVSPRAAAQWAIALLDGCREELE